MVSVTSVMRGGGGERGSVTCSTGSIALYYALTSCYPHITTARYSMPIGNSIDIIAVDVDRSNVLEYRGIHQFICL